MSPLPTSPPVVLTIAGSDCSSGAGLQADLKAFGALGCYGLTAVTCIVSEVPGKVERIQAVDPDVVASQVRLLLASFPIRAMKTGMLYSAGVVDLVTDALLALPAERRPHLVIDPVMIATSGDSLITPEAVTAYRERLFPLASLVTPNLDEAAALLGRPLDSPAAARQAALDLAGHWGVPFLVKGGHLRGEVALDFLAPTANGADLLQLESPYIHGVSTHGTGCTTSAAITAGLAHGLGLPAAVSQAKEYVTRAILHICRWNGVDALNHGDWK